MFHKVVWQHATCGGIFNNYYTTYSLMSYTYKCTYVNFRNARMIFYEPDSIFLQLINSVKQQQA